MFFALVEIFGQMQRQRSPGTKEPKELHEHFQRLSISRRFTCAERGRGEGDGRRLPKAEQIVGCTSTMAHWRLAGIEILQPPDCAEEIEFPRLADHPIDQRGAGAALCR